MAVAGLVLNESLVCDGIAVGGMAVVTLAAGGRIGSESAMGVVGGASADGKLVISPKGANSNASSFTGGNRYMTRDAIGDESCSSTSSYVESSAVDCSSSDSCPSVFCSTGCVGFALQGTDGQSDEAAPLSESCTFRGWLTF